MKALVILLPIFFLASCVPTRPAPPAPSGTVDHVVLFWLKRPGNAEDKKALAAAAEELRSIPGTRFFDHGTALESERPVVDDSFDFALVSRFDSPEALHSYETHPLHVKKVNDVLKPLSRRILVYDVTR